MNKIVLIIVPEFPPSLSIGARRWAKFAKYLAKSGYVVKVIAFKPSKTNQGESWMADIAHPAIEVFYLNSGYPQLLLSPSTNIVIRLLKKMLNVLITLYDGGIIQDKAIFFKKRLHSKTKELIKKYSIKNVICSGPYHRSSYYTAQLKEEMNDLNLIIDFRDRWTDGQVYGIEKVSERARKIENKFQQYTCERADYVISTYQEILNELKAAYPHLTATKFVHFSHNYDQDDYPFFAGKKRDTENGKITFIYGGTINTAAFKDAFLPFFNALHQLKNNHPEMYDLIDITIYGENYQVNNCIKKLKLNEHVKIFSKLIEQDFYKKVSESDCLLIFLGNDWKDLITTKNITYLPFRKPILVVSEEGSVSSMIAKNHLGYVIDPKNAYNNLVKLMSSSVSEILDFSVSYDYSEFSYEKATERLIHLFKP